MHNCVYANTIGQPVYFVKNERGLEVCGFCHVLKSEPGPVKAPAKSTRK